VPNLVSPRTARAFEIATVALLLGVSLAIRLYDPSGPRSSFPDLFDEGQDAESLFLMSNGFWPYRDIYVSQGPLKLPLMYIGFALFGGTLGAARLGVGLISMFGLFGAWWAGRQLAGAIGGVLTLFFLAASPAYLEASRQSLAEVPSIAPCLLGLAFTVRWFRRATDRWLYLGVLLVTVGVLVKPMAIGAVAPLGLLVLLRPGLRPRHVLISAAVVLGVTTVLVLLMGPTEIYDQMVQYRLSARASGGFDLKRNLKDVVLEPFDAQPGLFILAGVGALLLLGTRWRSGLALVAWPLTAIGILVSYNPLHPKHITYIYPGLVMVAGVGLGRAAQIARGDGIKPLRAPLFTSVIALAALLAALPISSVPSLYSDNPDSVAPEDADLNAFDTPAASSLRLLAAPNQFVLTDHPYVALQAQRMVPPQLVDISFGRIRAGVLTDKDTIYESERFDTKFVLTWADRLRRMSGIPPWLDRNFVLAQAFGARSVKIPRGAKDRSLYLRNDVDGDAARRTLESSLSVRETADFEGQLRLVGATVSRDTLVTGQSVTLTVGFLALSKMSSDLHVTVQLIGTDGEAQAAQEHDLDGGARGTSTWSPGRWLFRTFVLQPEDGTQPGYYSLEVAILDPTSGKVLRPTLADGARTFRVERSQAVQVASIAMP
jgi:hypothetical protein